MTASTIATKNMESNIRELFLSQFTITVEQKLLDFCTNEIGLLLSRQWNCNNLLNKAAVIGNPLRLVSLDSSINSDSTNKLLLNCTGSATVLEQNCTGKYLAISTGPNLSIFDLQKGSILRELHDHDGPINGITWHRDSPWQLATVGADSTLRLWDLRSHPAQISLRRTSKSYSRLEYSPDCNYIGCAGQMVSIFDLNMAQSIVHMACPSPANNICFNPAECLLATSSEDRVVRFWDVDTGECVTQSPAFDSSIGQICFTSDGQFLIVNTRKQISCIHWEPFELCSQLSYPIQMEIPAMANNNSPDSPPFPHSSPQINLLDLRIEGEMLHQLTVVKTDPTKIGTICVASIPIQKLEKCGLNNPAALEEVIPTCPIAKGQIELDEEEEEEEEEEVKQREEDDISPESIATSTTAESMIDSMTAIQQPHKLMQSPNHQFVGGTKISPFTAPTNRKRPPAGSTIKCGTSSVEIGVDAIASSMPNSSGMKMRQKRQQRQSESSTTPEFKGLIRPNQLPIIQNQQQHPSTSSSGQGSSDSSFSDNNRKTLIRRGSSLNDVNEIITTTKNNNMPISSIAMANAKNRSRSHQAQHIGLSKFTMSNGSTSSSNTSSSTSTIGDSNSRRRTTIQNTIGPANSMEEDIEEFIHFDSKIRSSINKQKKDIAALTANHGRVSGNITEHIVAEASHFEEPHVFAQLLKDYMRKPRAYSMSLNAAFLHRLNILIGHRNNQYVQFSIDFLDMVTTRFGDCIKHGLASQEYTIGVDVAAEQRFERCMKSRNALFQIHLNESIYKEHMDSKQRTYFSKEILPRINQIIYNESQASYNERANQSSFN